VRSFKEHGTRVVLGSSGCVSKKAEALNLNLCQLRNLDIEIADQEQVGFADVFWPMFTAGRAAQQRYATNYAIAGGDGVHPGGAGHLIMAYAFLHGLGLDGEIGTYTVDLKSGKAKRAEPRRRWFCRTSRPVPNVSAKFSTRRTGDTSIPSPIAPTAGRDSASLRRFRTIGPTRQ